MKPDWSDAPEWAEWVAMDDDGEWAWFEKKPKISNGMWRPENPIDKEITACFEILDKKIGTILERRP
jgi:hypothetical protein